MIHIYDGLLVIRRELEKNHAVRAPRRIVTDMLTLPPGHLAIWCFDGKGSRSSRQAIFPAYKGKRKPHPEDLWPLVNLIQEALTHTAALQINVPGFEADDAIATLVRQFPNVPKKIYSTDRDLSQLCNANCAVEYQPKVEARYVRLYKTCVGDPSDNIPGIPGFGQKTWDESNIAALEQTILSRVNDTTPTTVPDTLPPRVIRWLDDPANLQALRVMWTVVGLWDIPAALLTAHTKAGVRNPDAANQVLLGAKN